MTVTGQPRRYDKKFLFSVEIAGLNVAHFMSVSGLESELGIVEQHEGGLLTTATEDPGKVKYPPVVLSIGSTDNRELYDWHLQVVDAAANQGEPDDEYKRNVFIVQRERDGSEKRRFSLFKAWPHKYVAGDWDASAEENVIEQVTLVIHRWERQDAS